jgi:cephalosporin hydroxylase
MSAAGAVRRRLIELKFHPSVLALRRVRKALADAPASLLLGLGRARREALATEFRACATVPDCMEFSRRHMATGSCQIASEIEAAIAHIAAIRPRVMCEIGTFDGGTSLLFSRFLPSVELMLCIDLYVKNKRMLRLLAPERQRLYFLDRPSYAPATVRRVEELLAGRAIDALFIDGDHRYEGVRQDFLCYRPLVRDGGLILFHDIVESRGGRAWAGGVPRLWRELAPRYAHREFVRSRQQDGFGIGVLTV